MNSSTAFDAGVPTFGTGVLYAFLVAAAVAFGLALAAGTARPARAGALLRAARSAALGTCALVLLDVLLLAYAFVTHDFRIRYVLKYSDRSMPGAYLFAALWGGQDGSLLWWTLLLAAYTAACVLWLRHRHRELAPYVIATLMVVVMFFGVLMAYAANPFSVSIAGSPAEGEGLNPALQNFYMAIHPPSLYVGFVGCAVPFAFAIAALATGRLDDEWIRATRRWALFSWLFLSIGNTLGMIWAYEELGWGGFWAWDPVENAAALPWFTSTAFLHSAMIQERRGTLKIWNLLLVSVTFVMTIFGTFLTRSGVIASVHSFAQSDIGVYFLAFLGLVVLATLALGIWRRSHLLEPTQIDSIWSRDAMFVANNWILLGISMFVLLATTWPKLSEWWWRERLTVGPSFYNFWLPIPAATLLLLMGIGTLTPWRKASTDLLRRSLRVPVLAGTAAALAHLALGSLVARPAVVTIAPIYPSVVGHVVAWIDGHLPPIFLGLIVFNVAAIAQEFWRGVSARKRARSEGTVAALAHLVARDRRRYGGYVVHIGFVLMIFGWCGTYWRSENESTLQPGQSFTLASYSIRYDGSRMERDANKRMVFARLTVFRHGQLYAHAEPARFIYHTHPTMPTSEVSIHTGVVEDLYLVMASVNATTHVAHIKAFVNPFVLWIWLGCMVLVLGLVTAMWPEVALEPTTSTSQGSFGSAGGYWPGSVARGAAVLALVTGAALYARPAQAQGHTTSQPLPVGGDSEPMTVDERRLFDQMLCMCGDCQRLPLTTCTCDFAANTRATMRDRLRQGVSPDQIVQRYLARYGSSALAVPPDAGHNRAVYALPVLLAVAGGVLAQRMVTRWAARGRANAEVSRKERTASGTTESARAEYDRRIDQELRGLDE